MRRGEWEEFVYFGGFCWFLKKQRNTAENELDGKQRMRTLVVGIGALY